MSDPTAWCDYFPIKKGDIVVDLGAYTGETVCFFEKQVGKKGLVLALEPELNNFIRLNEVTKKMDNVIPVMMAIGNQTGETWLHVAKPKNQKYNNAHSTVFKSFRRGRKLVRTITWDDLVTKLDLTHVDLAKVNVEGAETELFEGMTKVLPKWIILDEHSRFGLDLKYLMELMRQNYCVIQKVDNLVYLERKREWK